MNLQPLPIGTSDFSALRSAGQIYVDKTEFVYDLRDKNTFLPVQGDLVNRY